MNNDLQILCIKDLFSSGKYIIPIYQRNYSWAEPEIYQLIRDIYDYAFSGKQQGDYYIGTLVVYKRKSENGVTYETIDGQQRLTTLNLMLSALNRFSDLGINYQLNLFFDSREKSTKTLEVLAQKNKELKLDSDNDYDDNILQAYYDVEKILKKLLNNDDKKKEFLDSLMKKVRVLRVAVPPDTDLNHYFEIMNTRGEQLEKHEILKARLIDAIKEDERLVYTFNLIWEACSDMERYVQYGFNISQRKELFGEEWNEFKCNNIDDVVEKLYSEKTAHKNPDENISLSLKDIVVENKDFATEQSLAEDASERFTSVVNFPNFLLHVLRVVYRKENISLDDKHLLETFDEPLKNDNKEFVKKFIFGLLQCRFLFDKYIIKREFIREKSQWSLKRLKKYDANIGYVNTFGDEKEDNGNNKELIMLQAMFHVSAPTMNYKHWLNAALYYLVSNDFLKEPNAQNYINYLTNLARAFLFDQYLAKEEHKVEFYDIIYKNGGKPQNPIDNLDTDILNTGTMVENFIFNFLDFILWKEKKEEFGKFEFSSNRSSVEHYYPRNPIATDCKLDERVCNNFGNLCLISRDKNSKLSNLLPNSKKDYYRKEGIDSPKQTIMMKKENWTKEEIEKHGEEMRDKLLNFK